MGSRYENTKNEVSKIHEKSEEIAHSQQKLQAEFSLLSTIDTILQNADSETVAAVQRVSEVGDAKAEELSSEYQENETEKTELSNEINAHLDKLFAGLEIIDKAKEIEFGQGALEETQEKYNQQIAKYKELLGELGVDAASSGVSSAGAETFTKASSQVDENIHSTYDEKLYTEEYSVQGVNQLQDQPQGDSKHQTILEKAKNLYDKNRSKIHDHIERAGVIISVFSALTRPIEAEQPNKNQNISELSPTNSVSEVVDSAWEKKDIFPYISEVIQGEGNDIGNQYEHILKKK